MKPVGLFLILFFFLFSQKIFSQEERPGGGSQIEASRRLELIRRLTEEGIPFEVRPLFSEYGGFGSSLTVYLPPEMKTEPEGGGFVLAIPLSSQDEPGEGFPYDLEMGLAFIKEARQRGLTKEIWVSFLGDEQSRLPPDQRKNSHTGLEDLLALLENPENTVLVYTDFFDPPEKITLHHGGQRTLAPLSLLQPIPGLYNAYGIPFTFAITSSELYKLGFAEGPLVLGSTLTQGIPSLYLEGTRNDSGGSPGKPIPAELLGALLLEYAISLNFSTENLDYHYLIFQYFGKTIFVPELITVIILWSLIALGFLIFFIYSIVLRKILIIQWKIFFRRSWVIVILFVVFFLALQGAELFFGFLLNKFALPRDKIYLGGIIFTLGMALTLFSLINSFFDHLKIPRKANFYGNAAVILTVLGSLIAVFLDITFIPAFVWAFLFTILAVFIPFSLPLYGIGFIIPLQIAGTLIASMGAVNAGFPMVNHANRIWIILFITITSFPSVLIFKRAAALVREQKKIPSRLFRLISWSIMLTACMGALTLYVYNLSKEQRIIPVRRVIVEDPNNPSILEHTITSRSFLARRILEINLAARGEPVRFDIYLNSEQDPQPIYTAPMPFMLQNSEYSPHGSMLEFILGENPPNPFTTDIVLPLTFSGSLRFEVLYTRYDPFLDPGQPPVGDDYVLRVTRTVPIGFGEN